MKHWYGVMPNGHLDGNPSQQAYMVCWFSQDGNGLAYCPASPDFKKGIRPGCMDSYEKAVQDAKMLSDKRYDAILYDRHVEGNQLAYTEKKILLKGKQS